MNDKLEENQTQVSVVPEKTSAWTDDEREKANNQPAPAVQVPELPPWAGTFSPGTAITHEGWECVVRHVGCEEGHWLMLVEPVAFTPPRSIQRSVYRRLVAQVGKKKAREMVQKAKRETSASPDNP